MTRYGAILADPPWSFRTWDGKTGTPHRTANDHYMTAPQGDLEAIPVAEWAAPDCALFMWVVDSHLPEALALARAWGFEYKTKAFTWRKLTRSGLPKIGMGYWTRKQTEMCLLFTRGSPRRVGRGVRELVETEWCDVVDAERREHSRKPDEVYERIEALVAGPYIEMFSRRSREGWDSWGDEAGKFDAKLEDLL